MRSLKPGIIINNRVGKGRKGMEGLSKTDQQYSGDFGTPEQRIPPSGLPGTDWESCMKMNDTWGFKSYDDNWKSTEKIIRNLIDIASRGGNYLLNVGPTAEGLIPQFKTAYLLVGPKKLRFTEGSEGIVVQTPAKAPDPIASVIVLETGEK